MAEALMFGPPIVFGLIIGIYEMIFIHKDVFFIKHRFSKGSSSLFFSIILSFFFAFVVFNAEFFLNIIPALQSMPILGSVLGLNILIGLVVAIKSYIVSKIAKTYRTSMSARRISTTWFHCIFIGFLLILAPYIYQLIENILPAFITGW
jgi:hypothetical protein